MCEADQQRAQKTLKRAVWRWQQSPEFGDGERRFSGEVLRQRTLQ